MLVRATSQNQKWWPGKEGDTKAYLDHVVNDDYDKLTVCLGDPTWLFMLSCGSVSCCCPLEADNKIKLLFVVDRLKGLWECPCVLSWVEFTFLFGKGELLAATTTSTVTKVIYVLHCWLLQSVEFFGERPLPLLVVALLPPFWLIWVHIFHMCGVLWCVHGSLDLCVCCWLGGYTNV